MYRDRFRAPVAEVDQTTTFSILGVQVGVNRISTVFENTDYASLAAGDLVEISGFYDGAVVLHATRIEAMGGNMVEVKGKVDSAGPVVGTFRLDVKNGITQYIVDYSGAVIPQLLAPGDFVEVKGAPAGATIIATEVERENQGYDDVGDASLEGIVAGFGGLADYVVAGVQVNANGASFSPADLNKSLDDGMQVEVEGPIVNGVLHAFRVEARGGDVRIGAMLES
jgi:hypothetical protein